MIVISPYVEQVFAPWFRGQAYLVENPCDERFFHVRRQSVDGRVLFAGSVIERKGVLPLIRAFHRVHQQMPAARLHVAGSLSVEPEYARACQELVRALGLTDAVAFVGQLETEALLEEYAHCAAFVLPSLQETAPVAIEEAMAAGVPCVATRVGGIPWMIEDGVTGQTVPAPVSTGGNAGEVADALLRVLLSGRGSQMGAEARRRAEERFRAAVVARRTREVYERVLGRS
jgi:glycosyltransferase involved in cell wall biosynthesis